MSRVATRATATLAAGLILAGAAACGTTTSATPKSELTSGIDALGNGTAMTVTVKLDATAQELQAIATATKGKLDATTAGLLAGADLTAAVHGSKKLKDYKPGDSTSPDMDLAVDLEGGPVVDLRTVDQVLYLKADVQKILTIAQRPQLMTELQARVATLPTFVKTAVAGGWISFPEDQAKALAGQLGGATATPNAAQSQALLQQLKAIVNKDVTVTRVSSGGSDGDHLRLTGSTRTLAADVASAVSSSLPGGGALAKQINPSGAPDRTVTVDAYVKGGTLTKLSLDLAQFATGQDATALQGKHLPLVMTFSDSAPTIEKPAGASAVDFAQLLPLLGALSGSSGTPAPTKSP